MSRLLLLLAYLGFVSLGLPDATLGLIWPSLRGTFALPQSAMGLVLVAGSSGYMLASLSAGTWIRRLGVGNLLALSTLAMTFALSGYSLTPVWPLFLVCAVLSGLGSGAIDTALNAYAAHHFSGKHMNWLHACYGVGTTLGPIVLTTIFGLGLSWRWGLGALALGLGGLTLAFGLTRQLWTDDNAPEARPAAPGDLRAALRQWPPWLQIAAFFVYAGVEVTAGQWSFSILTESRGVPVTTAGLWVGAYWGSLTVGRFLLGAIVDWVGMDRLLRLSMVGAAAGVALVAQPFSAPVAGVGLAVLGFSLAPIFPCLMSLTPRRFGAALSPHLVGLQTTGATLGVLTFPSLAGLLAERLSLEAIGGLLAVIIVALIALHEALVMMLRQPPAAARQAAD